MAEPTQEPVVHENPAWPDRVREKAAGRSSEQVAERTWIVNEDGTLTIPPGR